MASQTRDVVPQIPLALWRLYLEPIVRPGGPSRATNGFSGAWAHGWLFRQLAAIDPVCSGRVHDAVPKSFTISGLLTPPSTLAVGADTRYVEIAAWGGVTPVLIDVVVRRTPGQLVLGSQAWRIIKRERHLTVGEHLTGAAEQLSLHPDITVETPLSFRRGGQQWPFPVPDLWLANLAQRVGWDDFVAPPVVRVSWFRGETKAVRLDKYEVHGFVGQTGWDLGNLDAPSQLRVRWLLSVGEYLGVGYKTAMGLGRYRLRDNHGYIRPGQSEPA